MANGADLGAQADLNLHGKVLYGANRNYDNTITYSTGDIVVQDDRLWVSDADINTVSPDAATSGEWVPVSGGATSAETFEFFVLDWTGTGDTRELSVPHMLTNPDTDFLDILWFEDNIGSSGEMISIPVETRVTSTDVIGTINSAGTGAFDGHFVLLFAGGVASSSSGATTSVARKYNQTFMTADWVDDGSGNNVVEIVVLTSAHGRDLYPVVQIIDTDDNNSLVYMPVSTNSMGDVTLSLADGLQFNGIITII